VFNVTMQNFVENLRNHLGMIAVAALTVVVLLPFIS
jgi:hypothetical protein